MKTRNFLILFLLAINLEASAQFSLPRLSLGIQYSDISSLYKDYPTSNSWKRGVWGSMGTDYKISKWLAIEGNITYQERKPLEVFVFPFGDSTGTGGEGSFKWIFAKFPTSPQSKLFRHSVYRFIEFPNFKYLDMELIPLFTFGKHAEWSIGVGLFTGILLNRNLLIFGKEHFPSEQELFGPPFYVYGTNSYHRYDYGWLPKFSCIYPLNSKTKIGLTIKSYQSRVRLNDNFPHPRSSLYADMRWTAFLMGMNLEYKLQ